MTHMNGGVRGGGDGGGVRAEGEMDAVLLGRTRTLKVSESGALTPVPVLPVIREQVIVSVEMVRVIKVANTFSVVH